MAKSFKQMEVDARDSTSTISEARPYDASVPSEDGFLTFFGVSGITNQNCEARIR